MKVEMVGCDNPRCKSLDHPESVKPYAPPYGWIKLTGYVQGHGPALKIEVCSTDCVSPAVEEQRRRDREG